MMNLNKLLTAGILFALLFTSCKKDDDVAPIEPPRDRGEQAVEDQAALETYLETHFYNYEEFQNPPAGFDYKVRFDTISGLNSDKTPLSESPLLSPKTITRHDVNYTIYILKVREGEGERPTAADSTFVTYRGENLEGYSFDNAVTPVWFDLTTLIPGFTEAMVEFKSSTGFTVNPDNTVTWNNDFGVGAVFMPSGLAYFNRPPDLSGLRPYSPLAFGFELYRVKETDHDSDGIPTRMEDLDGDGILTDDLDDDTDADNIPNFRDIDDDGDGRSTRSEITIEEDGTLILPDTDGDGTPDYLDADS